MEENKRQADVEFYGMMHSGISQDTMVDAGVSVVLRNQWKTRIH
jgi:hypothetical protein